MKILLLEIMHVRGLTSRQLAKKSGVPRSTINDICNGAMPRINTLEKLARGLNLRISDLYESDVK